MVKGKGDLLSLPPLPLPVPLRVQLQGENGVCFEAYYDAAGVLANDAATGKFKARASAAPPVCGNGILEPGERCDGSPFCTAECFIDIPSCCSAPDQCIDAPSFSLLSSIFTYCTTNFPQWTEVVPGGVCRPDGSCSREPIAPLAVCCQRAGTCEGATVTETGDLYNFFSACQAPQDGTLRLGAACTPAGTCTQP